MARSESEDFQLYLSRVRPIYHQLFNMAHAITGNCDLAEYSLQYAMMDFWAAGGAQHGFREGLRNTLIQAAMRTADSTAEFTWNALAYEGSDENPDVIRQLIAQESIELRRALALKYGCGCSMRRIGRIMGIEPKRVQTALSRFEARTRRKLDANLRRRFDGLMYHAVKADFNQASPLTPDMGNVFRTFQADAAAMTRPSKLPARILRGILAAILALICVAGFWLAAILMQPPVLEKPVEIVEQVTPHQSPSATASPQGEA